MTYLYPKPVNVRILLSHKLQRVTDQYNDKRQNKNEWTKKKMKIQKYMVTSSYRHVLKSVISNLNLLTESSHEGIKTNFLFSCDLFIAIDILEVSLWVKSGRNTKDIKKYKRYKRNSPFRMKRVFFVAVRRYYLYLA